MPHDSGEAKRKTSHPVDVAVPWRAYGFKWISAAYLLLIYGLPTATCAAAMQSSAGRGVILMAAVLPVLWTLLFLTAAGVLSLPHRFAVTPGKIMRDLNSSGYFHRRLHGLCWTAIYYNKPAYFICLSIPLLKKLTFRLFGYRGSMNFTVYPDTWIRELPLLQFEDGVYVSNRATLGTNIVLHNGSLLVDGITLGRNALVGHLAVLGPGVTLGRDTEIGVSASVGIRTLVGERTVVSPCSVLGHRVSIGSDVTIGIHSFVDSGAILGDGVQLASASFIRSRQKVERTA